MNNIKKFGHFTAYISVFLLLAVILSEYFVCDIFARYATFDQSQYSARVAAFVFNIQDTTETVFTDLNNIKKPGDNAEYKFTVTNSNGIIASEVSEQYSINISVYGNMPIDCTVQRADDNTNILQFSYRGESDDSSETYNIANVGHFPAGKADKDDFIVNVSWPSDLNSAAYASGNAKTKIKLSVVGEQID